MADKKAVQNTKDKKVQPKTTTKSANTNPKTKPVPVFKNPTDSVIGKIVIWTLIVGFVGSIVAGIILLIIG
ncbi:hypothetical protein LJC17_04015 [Acholeplasma sp. OttesenSCG-928-E16]|nr:hypothetical protein [Acholeplasma sp. OttesenSCG-928-E16]